MDFYWENRTIKVTLTGFISFDHKFYDRGEKNKKPLKTTQFIAAQEDEMF